MYENKSELQCLKYIFLNLGWKEINKSNILYGNCLDLNNL